MLEIKNSGEAANSMTFFYFATHHTLHWTFYFHTCILFAKRPTKWHSILSRIIFYFETNVDINYEASKECFWNTPSTSENLFVLMLNIKILWRLNSSECIFQNNRNKKCLINGNFIFILLIITNVMMQISRGMQPVHARSNRGESTLPWSALWGLWSNAKVIIIMIMP